MSLVAVGSAKGSPGVTTVALALAVVWPPERRLLLAESDPAGSGLTPRFGLSPERGIATLAPLSRHEFSLNALGPYVQTVHLGGARGSISVLVGPRSYEQGQGLGRFWARFAEAVAEPATST